MVAKNTGCCIEHLDHIWILISAYFFIQRISLKEYDNKDSFQIKTKYAIISNKSPTPLFIISDTLLECLIA